ncbi:MAG: hypothetical protein HYS80_01475 [Candidatus Aenigmarchaeota archaeon]|nr:hypothetical protein [Candidatus Aenigmarchaeota archaeon]
MEELHIANTETSTTLPEAERVLPKVGQSFWLVEATNVCCISIGDYSFSPRSITHWVIDKIDTDEAKNIYINATHTAEAHKETFDKYDKIFWDIEEAKKECNNKNIKDGTEAIMLIKRMFEENIYQMRISSPPTNTE